MVPFYQSPGGAILSDPDRALPAPAASSQSILSLDQDQMGITKTNMPYPTPSPDETRTSTPTYHSTITEICRHEKMSNDSQATHPSEHGFPEQVILYGNFVHISGPDESGIRAPLRTQGQQTPDETPTIPAIQRSSSRPDHVYVPHPRLNAEYSPSPPLWPPAPLRSPSRSRSFTCSTLWLTIIVLATLSTLIATCVFVKAILTPWPRHTWRAMMFWLIASIVCAILAALLLYVFAYSPQHNRNRTRAGTRALRATHAFGHGSYALNQTSWLERGGGEEMAQRNAGVSVPGSAGLSFGVCNTATSRRQHVQDTGVGNGESAGGMGYTVRRESNSFSDLEDTASHGTIMYEEDTVDSAPLHSVISSVRSKDGREKVDIADERKINVRAGMIDNETGRIDTVKTIGHKRGRHPPVLSAPFYPYSALDLVRFSNLSRGERAKGSDHRRDRHPPVSLPTRRDHRRDRHPPISFLAGQIHTRLTIDSNRRNNDNTEGKRTILGEPQTWKPRPDTPRPRPATTDAVKQSSINAPSPTLRIADDRSSHARPSPATSSPPHSVLISPLAATTDPGYKFSSVGHCTSYPLARKPLSSPLPAFMNSGVDACSPVSTGVSMPGRLGAQSNPRIGDPVSEPSFSHLVASSFPDAALEETLLRDENTLLTESKTRAKTETEERIETPASVLELERHLRSSGGAEVEKYLASASRDLASGPCTRNSRGDCAEEANGISSRRPSSLNRFPTFMLFSAGDAFGERTATVQHFLRPASPAKKIILSSPRSAKNLSPISATTSSSTGSSASTLSNTLIHGPSPVRSEDKLDEESSDVETHRTNFDREGMKPDAPDTSLERSKGFIQLPPRSNHGQSAANNGALRPKGTNTVLSRISGSGSGSWGGAVLKKKEAEVDGDYGDSQAKPATEKKGQFDARTGARKDGKGTGKENVAFHKS